MSERQKRPLGEVSLVQMQPSGLIIDNPQESKVRSVYVPERRRVVDSLEISPRGVAATLSGGDRVLDIHHLDHPDKAYDDDDLVCIGFTSHYEAMRSEFGDHMVDGIAGENIIIDVVDQVWLEDLGNKIAIENQDTGELALLEMVSVADPCVEFSRFCLQRQQDKDLPKSRLGETLRFLGNGRRGFLLLLDRAIDQVTVRPGDKVYVVAGSGQSND